MKHLTAYRVLLVWCGLCLSQLLVSSGWATSRPFTVQPSFDWVFSGMVSTEIGERYGYYFEVQRHQTQFHVLSVLVNMETKRVVLTEENNAMLPESDTLNWRVGNAYLGFNTVTNRWLLGVTTPDGKGFDFKIDALPMGTQSPVKLLRAGLKMQVHPLGRLNGDLHFSKTLEAFVTAQHTWMRQLIAMQVKSSKQPMTNILCHFDDGSGFYAAHLLAPSALQGFIAGWYSKEGEPMKISQFVNIEHNTVNEWRVSSSMPVFHLHFSNLLTRSFHPNDLGAGVVEGRRPGFCVAEQKKV